MRWRELSFLSSPPGKSAGDVSSLNLSVKVLVFIPHFLPRLKSFQISFGQSIFFDNFSETSRFIIPILFQSTRVKWCPSYFLVSTIFLHILRHRLKVIFRRKKGRTFLRPLQEFRSCIDFLWGDLHSAPVFRLPVEHFVRYHQVLNGFCNAA